MATNDGAASVDPRLVESAERTLLAWIRTGLSLMGFGFVVARFSLIIEDLIQSGRHGPIRAPGLSLWIGSFLVITGVGVNIYAASSHGRNIKRIKEGSPLEITNWSASQTVSLTTAVVGLIMVGYLFYLGLFGSKI